LASLPASAVVCDSVQTLPLMPGASITLPLTITAAAGLCAHSLRLSLGVAVSLIARHHRSAVKVAATYYSGADAMFSRCARPASRARPLTSAAASKSELALAVCVANGVRAVDAFVQCVSQTHMTVHVAVENAGHVAATVRASAIGAAPGPCGVYADGATDLPEIMRHTCPSCEPRARCHTHGTGHAQAAIIPPGCRAWVVARCKRFTLNEREMRDLSLTADSFKLTDKVCLLIAPRGLGC
jgi:hypothetical protein